MSVVLHNHWRGVHSRSGVMCPAPCPPGFKTRPLAVPSALPFSRSFRPQSCAGRLNWIAFETCTLWPSHIFGGVTQPSVAGPTFSCRAQHGAWLVGRLSLRSVMSDLGSYRLPLTLDLRCVFGACWPPRQLIQDCFTEAQSKALPFWGQNIYTALWSRLKESSFWYSLSDWTEPAEHCSREGGAGNRGGIELGPE